MTGEAPTRRVCTRATSNGRWCWGPRFAAQLQPGRAARARKDEGEREESRNREDHPVTPITDDGGLPLLSLAWIVPCRSLTLTCWCVAAGSVPTWRLSYDEEKKRLVLEKPGTDWYEGDAYASREKA